MSRLRIRKYSFGLHYVAERGWYRGHGFWQAVIGLRNKRYSLMDTIKAKRHLLQLQREQRNKETNGTIQTV